MMVLIGLLGFSTSCDGNSTKSLIKHETSHSEESISVSEIITVLIPIQGMSCSSCAAKIKKGIKELKGVEEVEVSLERREAKVKFNSKETSPEIIAKAINKLGYKTKKPIIQK